MRSKLQFQFKAAFVPPALLALFAAIAFSSCATKYSTEPPSTTTTNKLGVDEFFTPPPTGDADDYYVMGDTDDDVDYSFYLDEQDYYLSLDAANHDNDDPAYRFVVKFVKNGHGYGDHNHIHEFVKGSHHDHGIYIRTRDEDWTDSIALTPTEKLEIDTAMIAFIQCALPAIDTFKVDLKPYRDSFRVRRLAIVEAYDTGAITRDSARILLDSAISKYETETDLLRTAFFADLATCRAELDMEIKIILTPAQYAIWVRHRGW